MSRPWWGRITQSNPQSVINQGSDFQWDFFPKNSLNAPFCSCKAQCIRTIYSFAISFPQNKWLFSTFRKEIHFLTQEVSGLTGFFFTGLRRFLWFLSQFPFLPLISSINFLTKWKSWSLRARGKCSWNLLICKAGFSLASSLWLEAGLLLHPFSSQSVRLIPEREAIPNKTSTLHPYLNFHSYFSRCAFSWFSWNGEKKCLGDNSFFILHCSDAVGKKMEMGGEKESQEETQVAREFLFIGK